MLTSHPDGKNDEQSGNKTFQWRHHWSYKKETACNRNRKRQDILIRCTREGKDAFEAVYKASLSEWTRLTGLTEEETFLEFDCGDIKDEKLFEEICNRDEQDILMSLLYDIPFVIVMY